MFARLPPPSTSYETHVIQKPFSPSTVMTGSEASLPPGVKAIWGGSHVSPSSVENA